VFSDYVRKKRIRSERTAEVYENTIKLWARSRGFEDPDRAIQDIKDRKLDPYAVLQEWVNHLHESSKAPKTILSYVTSVKGFLVDSDVDVTAEKMKAKVVIPQAYEVSTDRAPTRDEVRRLLLRSKLGTKAAIAVLASSGMRLGELPKLRVSDIEFGREGEPSKVTLKAGITKTRKKRLTFMSAEATGFVKEHLGPRMNDPNARIFRESGDAIYGKIMRALVAAGLRNKEDADSARYSLHPHCFRKYFFSNMLSAGVDRGIVEGFMGHAFALDSAYLRMSDEELANEYEKGNDRLTFLSAVNNHVRTRLEELEAENKRLREDVERLGKLEGTVNDLREKYERTKSMAIQGAKDTLLRDQPMFFDLLREVRELRAEVKKLRGES